MAPSLSTLRRSPMEPAVRYSLVPAERLQFTSKKVYDDFVEIGTTAPNGVAKSKTYMCMDAFIRLLSDRKYRVRHMKSAHGAWHWGGLHAATSREIIEQAGDGEPELAIFVGPVERVGQKKERAYLMPGSCIATLACDDAKEAVPGEILNADELFDRDFFRLWAEFEDDLKKAIPAFTFATQFQARRPKGGDEEEDNTCMICLDEPATFAWRACQHGRPTICEVCKGASEKPFKKSAAPAQAVQMPCCYCRTVSSIGAWVSGAIRSEAISSQTKM